MAKSEERLEARRLRRQGRSINEILKLVNVSKKSITTWCHDIKLTKKQEEKLWKRAKLKRVKNFRKYCERRRRQTEKKIARLYQEGIDRIDKLSKKEFFITGIALYWAEGFKTGHQVGFANSDPGMVKFFINWLMTCCGVSKKRLKVRVGANISHKDRINKIDNYWIKITGLPKNQFNKPSYKKASWKKKFEKPEEYFGVLQIRVLKSTDLLRKILGYIEGLRQNVAG